MESETNLYVNNELVSNSTLLIPLAHLPEVLPSLFKLF